MVIRRGEWEEEEEQGVKVRPINPWNNPFQLNSQYQHPFARFDEREQLCHADHTDRGLLGEYGRLLRLDQLLHERQSLVAEQRHQQQQIEECAFDQVCVLQEESWTRGNADVGEYELHAKGGGHSR